MRKIRLVQWPRGLMARWCMGHHPQRRYHDYHTLLGATRTANSLQSRWLLLLLLLLLAVAEARTAAAPGAAATTRSSHAPSAAAAAAVACSFEVSGTMSPDTLNGAQN